MENIPTTITELSRLLDVDVEALKRITESAPNQYRPYFKNKNGKKRLIEPPNEELNAIQKKLNKKLFQRFNVNSKICARCHRSMKDALLPHLKQPVVVTLDLKDFFPSIITWHLKTKFKDLGFAAEVSKALIKLTTYRSRLPQGAPTSPVLAQIYVSDFIDNLCLYVNKIPNINITVYVDDIIMSGPNGIQNSITGIMKMARRYSLKIHPEKIRIMKDQTHQKALGVYLNPLRVSPEFKTRLANAKEMNELRKYKGMLAFKKFIEG